MKDKRVHPAACLAAVLLLCGCNGGGGTSDTFANAENTSAETEVSAVSVTSVTTETPTERDNISDEQSALEKLIADTAGNTEGYTVQSPLFGDLDGDGKNELYARYGTDGKSSLWLADENGARQTSSEELEAAAQTDKNNG